MKVLENEDQFIKGVWAGLISGIVMFVFVETFRWLGLTKYGVSYLGGETVFTFKNNFGMNLIAFIIHSGVGVFWGIIFAFFFTKVFSSKYYILKSIFGGFCIFFFHLGFLDELFHYTRKIHEQTGDLLIILCGYIIYGIIVAVSLKKQGIISK
jgi:hypothetical protein